MDRCFRGARRAGRSDEHPVVPLAIGAPPVSEIAGEGLGERERVKARDLGFLQRDLSRSYQLRNGRSGRSGVRPRQDLVRCEVLIAPRLQSVCPPPAARGVQPVVVQGKSGLEETFLALR